MKQQRKLRLPLFIRNLKRAFYKPRAVFQTDPETNHHACIQVDNYAYVKLFFLVAEVGYIADPDLIRASCRKFLIKIVFAPFGFLIVLFFRALTNTAQPHILHQLTYHPLADTAASFFQDGGNFASTVDLAAVIVDCLNFLAKLLPALVVPSTAAFAAQQIIIKSAPRHAKRIAEHMYAVLVMQIIERIQPVFQRCGRGAGRFLQDFNDALQPVHLVFQAAIFTQCETCSLLRIFGSFIGKPCINRAAWDSCFGDEQRNAFPCFVGSDDILFFFRCVFAVHTISSFRRISIADGDIILNVWH